MRKNITLLILIFTFISVFSSCTGANTLLSLSMPFEALSMSTISVDSDTVTVTALLSDTSSAYKLDWKISWVNSSSSWASGKTVTQYVTVTLQSDGSNKATVKCLKAFGEQVKVTASLRGKAQINGDILIDYQQKIEEAYLHFKKNETGLPIYYTFKKDEFYYFDFLALEDDKQVVAYGTTVNLSVCSIAFHLDYYTRFYIWFDEDFLREAEEKTGFYYIPDPQVEFGCIGSVRFDSSAYKIGWFTQRIRDRYDAWRAVTGLGLSFYSSAFFSLLESYPGRALRFNVIAFSDKGEEIYSFETGISFCKINFDIPNIIF